MIFEHRVRVRFYQADPAGVLYFGRVFELVGDAYEELLRQAGVDVDALLRLEEHATPIVHAEADFKRPMRVGEEIVVRATVERVGESSVAVAYTLEGTDGKLRATARVVHVWIEGQNFRKVSIPEGIRAILAGLVDAEARSQ